MNPIHDAICSLFRVKVGMRNKTAVRCIFHNDQKPSAVVYFSDKGGGGWFECKGCHKSMTLKQVLKEKGVSVANKMTFQDHYPDHYPDEPDNQHAEEEMAEFKPGLRDVDLMETLYDTKGILVSTVIDVGGFISKHEYLVLPYGLHGKKVGRYLGETKDMPRFMNTGGEHRGFLGEECIRKNKILIMVEGVTCWLLLTQLGYKNVIAPFGSSVADDQAYMLRGKTVFILFDRDFGGFTGAEEAREKIVKYGGTPIVTELYEPEDYGENKIDVNYLARTEPNIFISWLSNRMNEYSDSDAKYLKTFRDAAPLKFYTSDLSVLNFTQGLYFVSGDSGVGKTTMGVALLNNFTDQGAKTLYVNYDLPKDQIISRLASRQSMYTWTEIEANHSVIEDKVMRWLEHKLKRCKIMNDLTIEEIRHAMQYFDAVVIDYFQQIPYTGTDERAGLNANLRPLSTLTSTNSKTVVCISRESLNGNPISGTNAAKYNCQGGVTLKKVSEDILLATTFKNTRGPEDMAYYKVDYRHQRILEQTSYAKRIEDPGVQDRLSLNLV